MLKIPHNPGSGFFSNCTLALLGAVDYYNKSGHIPELDRSEQYETIKTSNKDVSGEFFQSLNVVYGASPLILPDCMAIQFGSYRNLPFKQLSPFIEKLFTPSVDVQERQADLWNRYLIEKNMVAVIYRGNDKGKETETPTYQNFIARCQDIKERRPDVRFVLLPDECSFKKTFLEVFPDTVTFAETPCTDLRHSAVFYQISPADRIEHAKWFLAAVILCSKLSEVVTHSGNVGLWTILYRGHSRRIHQIYKNKWYV